MTQLVRKLFSTSAMVKPDNRLGEIPPTKLAYKTAMLLSAPAVAEMVLIALIGMMDTVMVGGLGSYAIAAVGITGQPRMLFMSLFFALNIGVTAIVSRRKGAGEQKDANLCLMQSLMLTGAMSVIMAVPAFLLSAPLMRLAGAKADTIGAATVYFQIVSLSLPIQAITTAISSAQRGVGNTKIALYINLSANVVNVIFNFLLIEGRFGFPRLEVAGASLATSIGGAVGLLIAILSISRKKNYLSFRQMPRWRPDWPMLKLISKIGGNAMFEQVCLRVGFFLYARIVADLGTFQLAAHQISMQMLNLTFTIGDGLSVASTALVGQNLGKKRPDLSLMYGKIGQRLAFVASAVMIGVILLVRVPFAGFFTNELALVQLSSGILILCAIIQPLQTSQVVMGGSLRGAGDTRYVAMTMLITVAVCRPIISMLFIHVFHMGLAGAWWAIFLDQIIRLVMLYTRFSRGRWMRIAF